MPAPFLPPNGSSALIEATTWWPEQVVEITRWWLGEHNAKGYFAETNVVLNDGVTSPEMVPFVDITPIT